MHNEGENKVPSEIPAHPESIGNHLCSSVIGPLGNAHKELSTCKRQWENEDKGASQIVLKSASPHLADGAVDSSLSSSDLTNGIQ